MPTNPKADHIATLVIDIRDCAKRANALGYFQRADSLGQIADEIEQMSDSRISIPPLAPTNQATRATATQHFKAARKLLKGIL